MPNTWLLAAHITIALALTLTVGAQSAELACARGGVTRPPTVHTLRATLWSTTLLAALTLITGGAVVADGARGGPWVGAGALSTALIGLASIWLLRRLRRGVTAEAGVLGAVQWGVPALTFAAAFLIADRPQNVVSAIMPVGLALLSTALAYVAAARSPASHAETRWRGDFLPRSTPPASPHAACAGRTVQPTVSCAHRCISFRECARSDELAYPDPDWPSQS